MMLFVIITSITAVLFGVSFYNYLTAPVFRFKKLRAGFNQKVSLLIPARNEEDNIGRLLSSAAEQTYSSFEVIVGNDNSTDNTKRIIDEYSGRFSFISGREIPPLPEGWKGKSHTVSVLADEAEGELLLFADADINLHKDAVSSAAAYMDDTGADVVSVFPRQLMHSWGERIIVPLLNFFLLSLLPLKQVFKSERVSLSAGIGQFILFKRSAYEKIGGHKAVHNKIAEDVAIIRLAKMNRLKVLTMLDKGLVSCRMYIGLKDAFNGFAKNFFPASSLKPAVFMLLLLIYCSALLIPLIMVFFNSLYLLPVLLIVTMRLMISLKSNQEIKYIFLHPLQSLVLLVTGFYSFYRKDIIWKGRTV
jgi:glycosyltransferase involved in cell wall biosynthesis